VQRQWSATTNLANRQPIPSSVISLAGGNAERARVIWQKLLLRQAFPMTFDEAMADIVVSPDTSASPTLRKLSTFSAPLSALGIAGSSPGTQPYESSVLLLLALERNNVLDRASLGGLFVATQPMGSGGMDYLCDAWRTPLAFARWPYQSPWLDPNGAQGPPAGLNSNDSGDVNGTLSDGNWITSYSGAFNAIANFNYPPLASPSGGVPQSYVLLPMIVSAGPDRTFGFASTPSYSFGEDGTGAANDNVTTASLPPSP
jgi:hypothetical protein